MYLVQKTEMMGNPKLPPSSNTAASITIFDLYFLSNSYFHAEGCSRFFVPRCLLLNRSASSTANSGTTSILCAIHDGLKCTMYGLPRSPPRSHPNSCSGVLTKTRRSTRFRNSSLQKDIVPHGCLFSSGGPMAWQGTPPEVCLICVRATGLQNWSESSSSSQARGRCSFEQKARPVSLFWGVFESVGREPSSSNTPTSRL